MRVRIRYCLVGEHYTLREECHGQPTITRTPPRYSPEDPYKALKSRAFPPAKEKASPTREG